jgi:hypothetical protein
MAEDKVRMAGKAAEQLSFAGTYFTLQEIQRWQHTRVFSCSGLSCSRGLSEKIQHRSSVLASKWIGQSRLTPAQETQIHSARELASSNRLYEKTGGTAKSIDGSGQRAVLDCEIKLGSMS